MRDLRQTAGVMRRALKTRGGVEIAAGAAVTLEGVARYVWIKAPTCAHCGVQFSCKIQASELADYVALRDPPAGAAPAGRKVLARYTPRRAAGGGAPDVTGALLAPFLGAAGLGAVGLTRFFTPTPAWVAWAAQAAAGRAVYDVGAGAGHVAAALARAGVAVTALDLGRPESPAYPVGVGDGGAFDYAPGAVVMLCRPCHGDFVERVVRRAVACDAGAVWYVGLDRNLDDDLGAFRGQFHKVLDDAGPKGERVWVFERKGVPMTERTLNLALVDWGQGPVWVHDDGAVWRQRAGSYCHKSHRDTVLERREGATRRAWSDLVDALQKAEWAAERTRIRDAVRAQCGDDLLDLVDEHGAVVARVPRVPFVCDALHNTTLKHLMPPWDVVSPSGLKCSNDSAYHSDWYFGAGFDLTEGGYYDHGSPVHEAACLTAGRVQRELGGFDVHVIVGGPWVMGRVGREIAVVPDLHPDRLELVLASRAVVTEAGGAVAHLANVGREHNIPIVRVPDARTKFPPGTPLIVDAEGGRVEIRCLSRDADEADEAAHDDAGAVDEDDTAAVDEDDANVDG